MLIQEFPSDIVQSDLVKYITVYYVFALQGGHKSPGKDFYFGVRNGGGRGQEMSKILILFHFWTFGSYSYLTW